MSKAPIPISVEELILDGDTQSRAGISEETVGEYAEVLDSTGDKWPFPPIDVFNDGSNYLVSSGFHRTLAAIRNGRSSVPCIIHKGTAWDAFLFGISANKKNALRPTRADKRHSVIKLLDGPDELTRQQVADMVGVGLRTVVRIFGEQKYSNAPLARSDDDPFDPLESFDPEPTVDVPFDDQDPFGEDDPFRDDTGTDSGTDASSRPPGSTETSEGSSPRRTPEEEFKIQRSKTIKTGEALVRAFDDLSRFHKAFYDLSRFHKAYDIEVIVAKCQELIELARNWK